MSAQIRQLSAKGYSVAEIARELNIRYQHAYGVVKSQARTAVPKEPLTTDVLIKAGFIKHGTWVVRDGEIALSLSAPKEEGVYAFAQGDQVRYVGLASNGLAQRLYQYTRPGPTMRTSIRIRQTILDNHPHGVPVDIYLAFPEDADWNGLPVHTASGLELGIIRKYHLPWNIRGA